MGRNCNQKYELDKNCVFFQLVPEASVVSGSEDSTPSPISGTFQYDADYNDVDDGNDDDDDHNDNNNDDEDDDYDDNDNDDDYDDNDNDDDYDDNNSDDDDDYCSGHSNLSAPLGSPAPANPPQRSQISQI